MDGGDAAAASIMEGHARRREGAQRLGGVHTFGAGPPKPNVPPVGEARSASGAFTPGGAMAHVLDPSCLRDDAAYVAALDELEDLMLADPGTPGGRRFDELVVLINNTQLSQ